MTPRWEYQLTLQTEWQEHYDREERFDRLHGSQRISESDSWHPTQRGALEEALVSRASGGFMEIFTRMFYAEEYREW